MAAGETIVLFDQGTLTLFDASPEGFEPRLQQKILEGKCWTAPVLANGRIYVRNAAGALACVGLDGHLGADRSTPFYLESFENLSLTASIPSFTFSATLLAAASMAAMATSPTALTVVGFP